MNKKIFALMLLVITIFPLVACAKQNTNKNHGGDGTTTINAELTLATIGSFNYDQYVLDFNQSNDLGITIKVEDYEFGTTREQAITRLNMELASGKGPDLIDFEAFPRREIYAQQGLLLELSELFERDLNSDDFYIIDLLKTPNMYFLPSGFSVMTCYGLEKALPNSQGWDLQTYTEIMSAASICPETQMGFLNNICISLIPSCVDWENMTCDFNNGLLSDVLAFSSTLNESPVYYDDLPEKLVKSGDLLYTQTWISSPMDIKNIEKTVGEDVQFIGYPTIDGQNGSYVYLSCLTGINASTIHKEYAWEFLKFMISNDEVQRKVSKNNIPVKIKVCDEIMVSLENPMDKYKGKTVVVNDNGTFTVDGVLVDQRYDETPLISPEQKIKFYNLIQNLKTLYDYDPSIYQIIENEAIKYFLGSKTIDDTISEIQARTSIYLSEQA